MIKWSLSGEPLILASASPIRAKVLEAAKLSIDIVPAAIDEDAVKQNALQNGYSYEGLAILLAELKAQSVSQQYMGYVLGCDQILVCSKQLFNKPKNLVEAKAHLSALQGRKHVLITACVLFYAQKRIWHHLSKTPLTMRALSVSEIDEYVSSFPEGTFPATLYYDANANQKLDAR